MTNSRIDHTGHPHAATAAGRKWCRENRVRALREAQQMFLDCDATGTGWDEYYPTVELYAGLVGVTVDEAYNIVERGPVA